MASTLRWFGGTTRHDERYSVGVLGQDAGGWGYITMGPDRNPKIVLNDGWGLLLPNYYYYMPPAFTTHATTLGAGGRCKKFHVAHM